MPRVNRDPRELQRRLANRRERQRRRRTTAPRYEFGPLSEVQETDGIAEAERPATSSTATRVMEPRREVPTRTRSTAIAIDYHYVVEDLRRIAVLVGALLIFLLVVWQLTR